ncbi:hypothetical protein PG985_011566 [Apiospora marii]|uniref:Histidine-specific methyltransferase SAM-dependent domain-containing protein n=1 Tax=Apiospora marii TaxID=335849 RepID=A0ABR1R0Y1_9PEZI
MPVELCVPNRLTLDSSAGGGGTEKTSQVDVSVEASAEESHVDIIDIRAGQQPLDLATAIRSSLENRNEHDHRTLPSLLLWNEKGLKLFEELTYVPEYYLTNSEIALLKAHNRELAAQIEPGTILLELGSGNLRKTRILLEAIEAQGKRVDYYALDLDRAELERTLGQLVEAGRFEYVRCHGLHGTYEDGQAWIAHPENAGRHRCVLSLGSTLGSSPPNEAAAFLRSWADTLRAGDDSGSSTSRMILGLDGCQDAERVCAAYNDPDGVNERFILNALDNANAHLGYQEFDARDWTVEGHWDAERRRHVQYLVPRMNADIIFPHETDPVAVAVQADERVLVGSSYKFDDGDRARMFRESWLAVVGEYLSPDGSYGVFYPQGETAHSEYSTDMQGY